MINSLFHIPLIGPDQSEMRPGERCISPPFNIPRMKSSPYYSVGSDCVLYHAYWDGTAIDRSGKGNNGTVHGATFVQGGLLFNGIGDYVDAGADSSLALGTLDVSFYFWIKTTPSAGLLDYFVQQAASQIASGLWNFQTQTADPTSYQPVCRFYDTLDSYWALLYQDAGFAVSADEWVCVQIIVSRADTANRHMIVNGVDHGHVAYNAPSERNYADLAAHPFTIGQGGAFFKGMIGEVLQFNSCKSDFLAFFNATKGRYGR